MRKLTSTVLVSGEITFMKTRIVYPQMWDDKHFRKDTGLEAKVLFNFLINNRFLGLSRYSRIDDEQILFNTNLNERQLEKAKTELQNMKWCFFVNGEWIYHNHECAYVDYEGRDRVIQSKTEEIANVPEEIKEVIKGLLTGCEPVLNQKPKTRNQKPETKNRGSARGSDESPPDEAVPNPGLKVLERWNEVFGTSYSSVRSIQSNLEYWLEVYPLDQILEVIPKAKVNPFWKDKITPIVMLRRKNPRGEDVDYIGELLNYGKKPAAKTLTQVIDQIPPTPREKYTPPDTEKLNRYRQMVSEKLGRKIETHA